MPVTLEGAMAKALPGATDHGRGVVSFSLYAPGKHSVHLEGDFNGGDWQSCPMHDSGGGLWLSAAELPRGKHRYRFVIDQQLRVCDPYAQEVAAAPGGEQPWAVIDAGRPIYRWQHDHWQRPTWRDLIVHEIHVGDFSGEGTLRGVIDRLDYLADLGVNALEFMPLYETEPGDYWGYEPTYYLSVRNSYGRFEDMLELVDAAHAHGMAVILDLVLAHTGRSHPFNLMYPYPDSPWYGQGLGETNQFGLPMLDFSKDPTNGFVRDVQSYWMRVLHVDGFRYDYLAGIGQGDKGRGLPYLMRTAREIHPDAYLIGECVPENPDLVNRSGLSGVWHTRSMLALQSLMADVDAPPYKAGDFKHAIRAFDPQTQGYEQDSFMVNYFECHDDQRLVRLCMNSGIDDDSTRRRSALAVTVLMTTPGLPMLFHGQEWGEDAPKTNSRTANKILWDRLDSRAHRGLREHYRRLIHLRRSRASIRSSDIRFVLIDDDRKLAVYHRCHGLADQVVIAVNLSQQSHDCEVEFSQSGLWHEFFSSEIIEVDDDRKLHRQLEPMSALIFMLGVS